MKKGFAMLRKRSVPSILVFSILVSTLLVLLCAGIASAESFDGRDWEEVFSEDFEGANNAWEEKVYDEGGSGTKTPESSGDCNKNDGTKANLSTYTNTGTYLGGWIKRIAQGKSVGPRWINTLPSLVDGYDTSVVKISFDIARSTNGYETVTVVAVQGDLNSGTTNSEEAIAHINNEQWLFSLEDLTYWGYNGSNGWIKGPEEDISGKVWYHFDFIVDCDSDTFDVYRDGTKIIDGYNIGVDFNNINMLKIATKKSGSKTVTYATYVDNISFSVIKPASLSPSVTVVRGGNGWSDSFKLRAVMGQGADEVPATAKAYVALYGDTGALLDMDIKSFAGTLESKYFRNSYNGTEPKYSKLLIWNGMVPMTKATVSRIVLPIAFDQHEGANGNWWVDDFDTGISAQNTSVLFKIDPVTYYLEMSSDNGSSWTRLSYRADHSGVTSSAYPLEEREVLQGTIRDYDNIYFSTGGKYSGALIPVEDSVFDTVTIEKGANEIGYAFLAAKPESYKNGTKFPKGYSPSYAAGYTRVLYSDAEEVTLSIPYNARYLYLYNNSEDVSYTPAAVTFTKSGNGNTVNNNSVRIATWNIGHYSLGEHSYSTIAASDFNAKSAEYEDYIDNVLGADVISLNEYSAEFIKGGQKAKNTIFSQYPISYEGEQRQYSCNALYAKENVTNITAHDFACNLAAGGSGVAKPSNYYYLTSDLNINGTTVKLVSVHLVYTDPTSTSTMADQQINELINVFQNEDRVIIMGDWNSSFDHFTAFTNAGYSLANTDYRLSTYSECQDARYYSSYIDYMEGAYDNIIYKGVNVSGFGLGGTKLSDHYGIYCTVTVD